MKTFLKFFLLLLVAWSRTTWSQAQDAVLAPNQPAPATVNPALPGAATNRPALPVPAFNTNLTPARTRPFPRPMPVATGTNAPTSPPFTGFNAAPATGVTPTPANPGSPTPVVFGDPAGANATGGDAALPGNGGGTNLANGEPVLLNFKDQPLDQVFDTYSRLSGKTVLRPATLPGAVTIKNITALTPEEAVQALTTVLKMNGIALVPDGTKFVRAVVANDAVFEGAPFTLKDSSKLPEDTTFITHVVKIKYADPNDIAQAISGFTKNAASAVIIVPNAGIVVLREAQSVVKRMVEVIDRIDTKTEPEYKLEIIPIKYGKVTDIYETMSSLIGAGGGGGGGGGTGATGGRLSAAGGGRGTSRSGSRGSGSGMRGGTSRGGLGGGLGGNMGGINPQTGQPYNAATGRTGNVAGNRTDFNSRIQSIVNRAATPGGAELQILGDAHIVPDERSNSLIVYANQEDMKMITNIVSKVDVLLAQVLIEAIVLQVDLGKKFDAGISATQNTANKGNNFGAGSSLNAGNTGLGLIDPRNLINGGAFSGVSNTNGTSSGAVPGGFSYFGKLGSKFDVALNLIASDSRANILQRPRIQTSHAVPGYFNIGNQVPYASIDPYGYGGYYGGVGGIGGGLSTRSSVQYLDVGTSLEVTPFITPDGLVVMEIYQEISSFDGFEQISTDVKGPKSSYKKAEATLSVRDGDTILLGGYISDSKSKTKSGVPVLMDIPVLGNLFRSKSNSDSRSELVILLHVTVLKSPADASLQAESEKSASIKAAERELKDDEKAREKSLEQSPKKKK
ncbi:MAG: hypothetical protein HY043_16025 [Verrucomicrobia bacterium]|nr:hypothetical protein [Verrucomicrobiota bacterium]